MQGKHVRKWNITFPFLFLLFTGCTYSINLIDTEGEASDIVDEVQSAKPEIQPNLNLP